MSWAQDLTVDEGLRLAHSERVLSPLPQMIPNLIVLLAGAACSQQASQSTSAADARASHQAVSREVGPPESEGPDAGRPEAEQPEAEQPEAGAPEVSGVGVAIPAGTVQAGSRPGDRGRNPSYEMDGEVVEVPAFEIDGLPYPNDPAQPARTNVTFAQARQLCRERGKRLCHELEWERACEGASGQTYPYGQVYREELYQDGHKIVSPFGVRFMGAMREWTAGPFAPGQDGRRTVRGSHPVEGHQGSRRCAQRLRAMEHFSHSSLGFRCCRGPVAAAEKLVYRTPRRRQAFTQLTVDEGRFQAILKGVPHVAKLIPEPQMFAEHQRDYVVRQVSTGDGGPAVGTTYTVQPVLWRPVKGEDIWVAVGHSGGHSFVVALHLLPGGGYRHGASYLLKNDPGPLALGYTEDPKFVRWLPCLGCKDGGMLFLDDEGQIQIGQRW